MKHYTKAMTRRRPVPVPLVVVVAAVLVVLLVASATTGQWTILALGLVALAAIAVPFRNR